MQPSQAVLHHLPEADMHLHVHWVELRGRQSFCHKGRHPQHRVLAGQDVQGSNRHFAKARAHTGARCIYQPRKGLQLNKTEFLGGFLEVHPTASRSQVVCIAG